jgi:hypothetical protein
VPSKTAGKSAATKPSARFIFFILFLPCRFSRISLWRMLPYRLRSVANNGEHDAAHDTLTARAGFGCNTPMGVLRSPR